MSILDDLNDLDFDKLFEELENTKKWENNNECNEFLKFILNYLTKNKSINSEEFLYMPEKCPNYTSDEFSDLFFALYDKICNYGKEKNLSAYSFQKDKNFIVDCFYLKIENIFYYIEKITGQGTCIVLEKLKKINNDNMSYPFIDYNLMMKEE